MNQMARDALCDLVAARGIDVCSEPRRFRSLMRDACPELRREVHVLCSALESRVVADLLNSSSGMPWEMISGRLVRRLVDDVAMDEVAARWAVHSWGMAVGKLSRGTPTPAGQPPRQREGKTDKPDRTSKGKANRLGADNRPKTSLIRRPVLASIAFVVLGITTWLMWPSSKGDASSHTPIGKSTPDSTSSASGPKVNSSRQTPTGKPTPSSTSSAYGPHAGDPRTASALPARQPRPETAPAEQETGAPTNYVVLVGISDYGDSRIKPRKTAETDIKNLYELFDDAKYLEGRKELHLLLGKPDGTPKAEAATKANILKSVADVTAKAKKDDLVIIALIGQGAPLGDKTCFLASDSTFKDRAANAVSSDELENAVKGLKSQMLVAILDINLKGYDAGKQVLPDPSLNDLLKVFIGNEEKEEEHAPPKGRVVLLSGNGFTQPVEHEGQGLFTKVLVQGLKGAADIEPDGTVAVDEIDVFLERELPKLARQIGTTAEERDQESIDVYANTNHFRLTSNPDVRPLVLERLAKLRAEKLDADAEADGVRLLERVPRLEADQALRKSYLALVAGKLSAADFAKQRSENLAARKLPEDDAREFADRVFLGEEMVRRQYVRELNSGEMVAWAVRGMYRTLEMEIPAGIKVRLDKTKEATNRELKSLLTDMRLQLGKREDLDNKKDVETAMHAMLDGNLDPYTTFIDKEQKAKADMDLKGQFTGIGVHIRRSSEKNALLVVSPIRDSPAYKAKLLTGDLITEIITDRDGNGKELPGPTKFSTQAMTTETAIKHILGDEGKDVTVTVVREGEPQPLTFWLKRARINVETVLGHQRKDDDTWDYYIDPQNKIGYIQLTQFAPNSYRDMQEAMKKLRDSGVKGLILDLRYNRGGLLDTAVHVSDMFIDDGLIVTIRPRVGQELAHYGYHENSYEKFPMVVLVNHDSASASEIVAACLQDHSRAIIMGERTYGKGCVQHVQQFASTEGEIKLTTALYWRPNMKNLNKPSVKGYKTMTPEELEKEDWGVKPDAGYEVKLDNGERNNLAIHLRDREIIPRRDGPPKEPKPPFTDKQLEKALRYLRSNLKTAKGG